MNRSNNTEKWITRRTEHLFDLWSADQSLARKIAIERGYLIPDLALSLGLSTEVSRLMHNAWSIWGPHVPIPPVRYAALVVPLLQLSASLHPSLASWVLAEVGAHVRRHGWVSGNRHLFRFVEQIKTRLFQRYAEWLVSHVVSLCEELVSPIEREFREKMALGMVRNMYSGVGISGITRRIEAWSRAHHKGTRYCSHACSSMEESNDGASRILSESMLDGISPAGLSVRHLWNRELLSEEGAEMRHCVGVMGSAIRAMTFLFLSLAQPETGRRATAILALNQHGRWYIEELRGVGNQSLTGTKIEKGANELLGALNALRDTHPLLEQYAVQNRLAKSDFVCKNCADDECQEFRFWIPGIGKNDAKDVLLSAWRGNFSYQLT